MRDEKKNQCIFKNKNDEGIFRIGTFGGLNLGHARADDTANETKKTCHTTHFTMKADFKSRLPP